MTPPYSVIAFYVLWALAVICLSHSVARPDPGISNRIVKVIQIDPREE